MRPEEIRRIRRRIDTTLSNFRSIYGCYVNAAGEIVTTMEIPVLDMETEERERHFSISRDSRSFEAFQPERFLRRLRSASYSRSWMREAQIYIRSSIIQKARQ